MVGSFCLFYCREDGLEAGADGKSLFEGERRKREKWGEKERLGILLNIKICY